MGAGVRQLLTVMLGGTILLTGQTTAATRGTSRVKTVLVLGDSLSEGFRLNPHDAWPSILAERLRGIDPAFRLLNGSVSGSTSLGGLRRLATYLNRPLDIFIVELGINDAFRGASVEEIRNTLQMIIDKVRAKNPKVAIIVAGMQFPIATADDDYVVAFGKMFAQVAETNRATLIPYLLAGVGGDPRLNLEDRIHPNAAGHRILADTVWDALEPIARQIRR